MGASPDFTRRQLLTLTLFVEGGLGALAVVLGLVFGLPVPEWVQLGELEVGLGILATLSLFGLLLLLWHFPVGPLKGLMRYVEGTLQPMFRPCRGKDLLVVAILAGVGEELFFRGLVQGGLARLWGDWAGLVAASVLFGLAHCATREYVLLATLMGLFLGWLVLVTGNLAAAIIAHGGYDYLALLFLVRAGREEAGNQRLGKPLWRPRGIKRRRGRK